MAITVYGLPGCDQVRKARAWLAERRIDAAFHNLRGGTLSCELLTRWLDAVGAASLVNRRSTSWRQLSGADRARAEHAGASLVALLREHPTLIRRPVIDWHGRITVGFEPARWPPT